MTSRAFTPRAQTYWYHPHFIVCGGDHSADGGNTRAGQMALCAPGLQANKNLLFTEVWQLCPEASNLFQHIGMPVLFRRTRGALLCGISPQVLPCSVTDATSKACGRTRQRLQKPQKYRVYPRSAEPSFSLLLYQPSLKASTHNRPFRIANHQMLHLHSAISLLIRRQLQYLCELTHRCNQ